LPVEIGQANEEVFSVGLGGLWRIGERRCGSLFLRWGKLAPNQRETREYKKTWILVATMEIPGWKHAGRTIWDESSQQRQYKRRFALKAESSHPETALP